MRRDFNDIYVGGRWWPVEARFDDINPADDKVWARVPDSGVADVHRAIESADHAFKTWSELPFNERAHYMIKVAEIFEARKMDVVKALQGEAGGWFGKGMFEATYVPEVFYAAAAANYAPIGEILPSEHHKVSMAVRRPMGVVSVISPWNFPTLLTSRGIAFALSAGNTVVLKPSE